jgi:hypothetical protein
VDILSSGLIAIIALISEALIDLDPVYLEVVLDFEDFYLIGLFASERGPPLTLPLTPYKSSFD